MRKAKMSFQSGQVKQVIRAYSVEIQTDSKKDLEEEAVTMKLRKAMGANCKSSSLIAIDFRKRQDSGLENRRDFDMLIYLSDDRQKTNY